MKKLIPEPQVITIICIIFILAMVTSCGVGYPPCGHP